MRPYRCLAIALMLAGLCRGGDEHERIEWWVAQLRRMVADGQGDMDKIRACLGDKASAVRVEAAVTMFKLRAGAEEALAMLRNELRAEDEDASVRASTGLASIGERGVEALVAEVIEGRARSAAMCGLLDVESLDATVLRGLTEAFVRILSTSKDPRELGRCLALARGDPTTARACAPRAFVHLRDGMLAGGVLAVLSAAGPDESFVGPVREFIRAEHLEFPTNGYGYDEYELASSVLCRLGPEGVRALLDRVGDIRFRRHLRALRVGIEQHIDIMFPHLLEATRSPKPLLRQRVLGVLAKVDDPDRLREAEAAITKIMLEDTDLRVRAVAADVLPQIVGKRGVLDREADLRAALVAHPDDRVRIGAFRCLFAVDKLPVEFMASLLDDPSDELCADIVWTLGARGTEAAVAIEGIIEALERGVNAVRCIEALVRIAPEDEFVISAIRSQLGVRERRASQASACALAIIGPKAGTAEDWLRELVRNDEQDVRPWRRLALYRISGKPSDLAPLLEELAESLRGSGELAHKLDVCEILLMLGQDARSLLPVVEERLRAAPKESDDRKRLESVRIALGG